MFGAALYTATTLASGGEWSIQDAAIAAGTGLVAGALVGTGVGIGAGATMMAGIAVGAGTSMLATQTAYTLTHRGDDYDSAEMVLNTAVGGVAGAITGGSLATAPVTLGAMAFRSSVWATTSVAQYSIEQSFDNDEITIEGVAASAAIGFVTASALEGANAAVVNALPPIWRGNPTQWDSMLHDKNLMVNAQAMLNLLGEVPTTTSTTALSTAIVAETAAPALEELIQGEFGLETSTTNTSPVYIPPLDRRRSGGSVVTIQ